jgi:hypothetical protein
MLMIMLHNLLNLLKIHLLSMPRHLLWSHSQSLAEGGARRKTVRPKRLIQEYNVAFAFTVAEEVDNI